MADRLCGVEIGLGQPWLGQLVAILHLCGPVAHLPVEVKEKTCWTTNGRESVASNEVVGDTPDHVPAV